MNEIIFDEITLLDMITALEYMRLDCAYCFNSALQLSDNRITQHVVSPQYSQAHRSGRVRWHTNNDYRESNIVKLSALSESIHRNSICDADEGVDSQ